MGILEGSVDTTVLKRPWRRSGAPVNGAAGTLVGIADPGDLLIRTDTPQLYQNTNTKASPTWTQFASGTGNTLDQAYDQGGAGAGRAITVDTGAVALTNNAANGNGVLTLEKTPAGAQAGNLAVLTMGANATGVCLQIANSGSGNDITATNWSVTQAGQASFVNTILANGTLPAGTNCYIGRDNAGDMTVNALVGKSVNLAVAGTDVVTVAGAAVTIAQALTVSAGGAAITGNSTITGDLTVTGSLTFGGNWTVAATLTVDELILDTDGVAPAATNCYAVRDNAGDLTLNAITGKQILLAINGSDEYTFSATVADFNSNAIDNAGYLVLNAATAPAGTEVYAVNDNTGDLTLNALAGKTINVAVAGTDEYTFSATVAAFAANNLTFSTGEISFSGAGGIDLAGSGYLKMGTNPAAAGFVRLPNNTYITARNAANGADVNVVAVNGSDLVAFGANVAAYTMAGTLTVAAQQISLSTGNVTFSGAGYIAMGVNPAASGYIRLLNTGVIAWRNAANAADISALQVDAADDVAVGADLQMGANSIYGATASGGNLTLLSTTHATKGAVVVSNAELGIKIGGTAARATTPGTNALHLFNGTAPVGTLTNGVSLYSEGGEMKAMDAAGNATVLSPHTPDGDFVIHSYSAKKDQTVTIHLEKLLLALADSAELKKYVKVKKGNVPAPLPV